MSEFLSCARSGVCASPVVAYRNPSGPNASRPPLWNRFFLMPLTSVVYPDSDVPLYVIRAIRLPSLAVCMKYTKWLVAQSGSTATPSRPPSPPVPTAFGTVPTCVLAPARVTLNTLNDSRSVTSAVWPSGIQ